MLAQLFAEGPAQRRNILSEVVFFDDRIRPGRAQQLFFGHGLAGAQHQVHERLDRLRHQRHGRTVRIQQLAPHEIQAVTVKLIDFRRLGAHETCALTNPQKASAILTTSNRGCSKKDATAAKTAAGQQPSPLGIDFREISHEDDFIGFASRCLAV